MTTKQRAIELAKTLIDNRDAPYNAVIAVLHGAFQVVEREALHNERVEIAAAINRQGHMLNDLTDDQRHWPLINDLMAMIHRRDS